MFSLEEVLRRKKRMSTQKKWDAQACATDDFFQQVSQMRRTRKVKGRAKGVLLFSCLLYAACFLK